MTASKRRMSQLSGEEQTQLADVTRQREQFASGYSKLEARIASLQAAVVKGRTALQSAIENSKRLAKNVLTLRAEREGTKSKLSTIQNALNAVKQQTVALQMEYVKAGEIYKAQLVKSFEKRKALEKQVEKVRLERESNNSPLELSISEHGSAEMMSTEAQIQRGQVEVLERNVNRLEAENAQLSDKARRTQQEYEALKGDVAELEELRIHNQQLARIVESLESSRKQHEDDAERYRGHADQSEQLSETLRIKLDDLQKNFADIEKQQNEALQDVREAEFVPTSGSKELPPKEIDDLQRIVGIGKASEQALNDLGIFNFRQIAAFNVGDIARINMKLSEFKGRMEQDDWIGQAKILYSQKYGEAK